MTSWRAALPLAVALVAEDAPAQVTVGGLGYVHYRYQLDTDSTLAPAAHRNSFDVSRLYLTVRGQLQRGLDSRVTIDVDDREGDGDALQLRLKYAYLAWRPDTGPVTIRLGMIPTPMIGTIERIWDYRMQGSVAADRNGYLVSSDFGVSAESSWHQDRVTISAGLFNGEGYDAPEGDHRKDVAARASWQLAQSDTTGPGAGLRITGYGHFGRPTGGGIRSRMMAMLSWQSRRFTLGAEQLWSNDSTAAAASRTRGTVTSVWGVYRMPGAPVAVIARVDRVDPDVDVTPTQPDPTSDVQTRTIVGVSYQVSPQVRILVDADLLSLEHGSPDNAFNASRRSLYLHTAFTF